MKVNFLTNYGNVLNISNKRNNNRTNYLNNPLCEIKDSVSFSAKRKTGKRSSQKAGVLGLDIYKNALSKDCNLAQTIKTQAPDIEVLPIIKMPQIGDTKPDYAAFFSAQIDKDFNCNNYKMYIDENFYFGDETEALTKAMDIAHEYTHYLQAKNGEEGDFLRSISDEWEYFGALSAIVSLVFKKFDTEIQAHTLMPLFYNMQDMADNKKYNRIIPKQRNITREIILKANGYNNMKEFCSEMNQIFEAQFYKTKRLIETMPKEKIDPNIQACISKAEKNGKLDELKEHLRMYCAFNAQKEKEAYLAECEVAKGALKTRKPINSDAFPLFYDMLYDAFAN